MYLISLHQCVTHKKREGFPKGKKETKGKNTVAVAHVHSLCFSLLLQLKLSTAGKIKMVNLKNKSRRHPRNVDCHMMLIPLGDKGIGQITERIYSFHIREFFAFQMKAEECFQGFTAVQGSRCMAAFYNPIYIKYLGEERASWKGYRVDVYRSCRRYLVVVGLNCFFY